MPVARDTEEYYAHKENRRYETFCLEMRKHKQRNKPVCPAEKNGEQCLILGMSYNHALQFAHLGFRFGGVAEVLKFIDGHVRRTKAAAILSLLGESHFFKMLPCELIREISIFL